jgi:hypothetical protein
MNFKLGGAKPAMCDGWFLQSDGKKVIQRMVFESDHPSFPNQPKGMKQVIIERGLWKNGLTMKCKDGCNSPDCCTTQILSNQPDFKEQCLLVQEVIEDAGHICIFLPKFHCELNFIEYFWGAVKQYLCEHCDYSFSTL